MNSIAPQAWFDALQRADGKAVREHLSKTQGQCVHWTDLRGRTALHVLLDQDNPRATMLLGWMVGAWLAQDLPLNAPDHNDVTPLGLAIDRCNTAAVRQLIKAGAPVKSTDLAHAAQAGHVPVIEALWATQEEGRAALGQPDADGQTPLHRAVQAGAVDMVRWLMPRVPETHPRNAAGHTPWWEAWEPALWEAMIAWFPSDHALWCERDAQTGGNWLHHAIARRHAAAVRWGAQHHPEWLEEPDASGAFPLHQAVLARFEPGVEGLLEAGAAWAVRHAQTQRSAWECVTQDVPWVDDITQARWQAHQAAQASEQALVAAMATAGAPVARLRL